MTTLFLDGPAKDVRLELERTPVFLRVVMDQDGTIDALDQLDDTPKPTEFIYVYRIDGEPSRGFACGRDAKGKRSCRHFVHAEYKLYPEQPSQEGLRDFDFWSSWAEMECNRTRGSNL